MGENLRERRRSGEFGDMVPSSLFLRDPRTRLGKSYTEGGLKEIRVGITT